MLVTGGAGECITACILLVMERLFLLFKKKRQVGRHTGDSRGVLEDSEAIERGNIPPFSLFNLPLYFLFVLIGNDCVLSLYACVYRCECQCDVRILLWFGARSMTGLGWVGFS